MREKLELNVRYWICANCQTKHGRDLNASIVIQKVGASTLGLTDVSQFHTAVSA